MQILYLHAFFIAKIDQTKYNELGLNIKINAFSRTENMVEILGKKYLTEKEASHRYGYSPAWFQRQRSLKLPPQFIKLQGKGKVYYETEIIDKWFKDNMKVSDNE